MTQIDNGTVWLIIIVMGIGTFLLRLSFIALFGRFEVPPFLRRLLRFVPSAVFSAFVFPVFLIQGGELALLPVNARLIAGLLAALVAWRTKNVLLTIGVGMVALWILQAVLV